MRTRFIAMAGVALLLAPALALGAPPQLPAPDGSAAPSGLSAAPAAGQSSLVLETGAGRVVTLPAPIANVFVSDPKIVEVKPASATSLFMFGVAPGRTTVAALDANGQAVRQYEITVRPSAYGAGDATSAIARVAPSGSGVHVENQSKRLVISGRVATPREAHAAAAAALAYAADGQTIDNQLRVAQPVQIGLRVRIAEMTRSLTRALGVNWQSLGTFGKVAVGLTTANALNIPTGVGAASALASNWADGRGNSVNSLIDALSNDNLIHVLAEPNLTAMSGETASFLVGGEFPVPVAQQNNTITVDFKPYGVSLAFVPTMLSDDRIRIKVRPEVSQLTTQGAVQLSTGNNSISIPALTVRRAETTIEMGSGQSFAMAGLLLDNTNQTVNALPGAGEIPILGALFRSDSFQRNETELVIIVTPYVVRPVNDPNALHLPTDGYHVPTDLERLLMLRQVGRGSSSGFAQRVPGQAGFVIE